MLSSRHPRGNSSRTLRFSYILSHGRGRTPVSAQGDCAGLDSGYMTDDRHQLLTVPEAAARLAISRRSVYDLMSAPPPNQLKSIRVGGSRRIVEADLNAYIEKRRKDS